MRVVVEHWGRGAGVFLNDRAWTFEVGLYILSFAWY